MLKSLRSAGMLSCLFIWCHGGVGSAAENETPLTVLPYTPSLDTQFLDRSVDPCVDFYRFACGAWNTINPIPPDQERWDVYSKLANENERFLWGILQQSAIASPKRTANEQKIGDYFGSCMNEDQIEKDGLKPIEPSLARVARLQNNDDFAAYLGDEHKTDIDSVLFGFSSGQDFADSSSQIAFAGAGGLGLPDRDYYTKTDAKSVEIRSRYVAHVESMLQLLGESQTDAHSDAASVMRIETALAEHSLTKVEKRNPHNLDHKGDRTSLDRMTPALDWQSYLTHLGAPAFHEVNMVEPRFFAELNELLRNDKLPAWRAYFRWQLVNHYSMLLPERFRQNHFAFYNTYLKGVPQMPPRWKTCTRMVDEQLGEALGQVFVSRVFGPQLKEQTSALTRQIEGAMESEIHNLDWMSDDTKKQALVKLHTVVNKIGYPDHWRDYSAVSITPNQFAGNVAEASAFEKRRQLTKIGQPVDRSEWGMTPPTVNAYYDPQMNDINFPAGVLQPPLYDARMDAAPNYGNTGATIGHELTHGFDDEGRQFDAHGNLKDWWTASDAKQFEDRASCIKTQYAGYTVIDNIKINSDLTLGEDIADLGGTLIAYLAWKTNASETDKQPLDGFTPEQRFFIGMAQWACGDQRPESKRAHAVTDPHSPDAFRINGVVSNMPEFATAFGCKVGQPMVRADSCRIW